MIDYLYVNDARWVRASELALLISHNCGYEVFTHELPKKEAWVSLWSIYSERQGQWATFMFKTPAEKDLARFIAAQADGVGPATAARLVQDHGLDNLKKIAMDKDAKAITAKTKGVGPTKLVSVFSVVNKYNKSTESAGVDKIAALRAMGFTQDLTKLVSEAEDETDGSSEAVIAYVLAKLAK